MESDFSKAIHEVLVQEGESGYYVTKLWIPPDRRKVLEKEKNDRFHRFHWYVPLVSFWDVIDKLPPSDTVCYSESCRWVIVLGEDKLALVACDEQFYSTLLAKIPDAEAKVHEFLEYVVKFERERSDTENWISPLLHHIYDQERADKFLNQYGY
ncbi:MAG: hypothetical protein EPO32_12750 [Anaerolineae bacterium]|nr:MAG: hypothetical protein EPO32_12750 [Anaerolineae bacterium]